MAFGLSQHGRILHILAIFATIYDELIAYSRCSKYIALLISGFDR